MENTLRYHLTITDGDKEVVKIEAPNEEFMLEKLGAFERSRRKVPLVVWPPKGAKKCKWCGDVTDGIDYCDAACQYDEQQELKYMHEELPGDSSFDPEYLAEQQDKSYNLYS